MQNTQKDKGFLWQLYMAWVWASWPSAIALAAIKILGSMGIAPSITGNVALNSILTFMSVGVVAALIAIEDRAVKRGRLDLNFGARIIDEIKFSGSNALAKARAGLS